MVAFYIAIINVKRFNSLTIINPIINGSKDFNQTDLSLTVNY